MADSFDFVIIGAGFGGSVSAMRLTEKGYSVLILEKGKRYEDKDFAKTNWQFWKYLWLPALRAHGILQVSILKGAMILHGAGVGGGSLGYANVLGVYDFIENSLDEEAPVMFQAQAMMKSRAPAPEPSLDMDIQHSKTVHVNVEIWYRVSAI